MYENAITVRNKNNNEKKNKRHSKPASNVNTNNRRMTGNVNIYICSESNNSVSSLGYLFSHVVYVIRKGVCHLLRRSHNDRNDEKSLITN